ncbi:intestinal mucin-like protein [Rhinophrynus dorsalis]
MDTRSQFYTIQCQPIVCDTTCSEGYIYKQKTGQCCGECVSIQQQCSMTGQNKTEIDMKIGEIYRPEDNKCSYYECKEENGKAILTKVEKVCQELNIDICDMSTLMYDNDGCCMTCKPKKEVLSTPAPKIIEDCSARKNVTVLKQGDCVLEVELTYCGGPCMGSSMYSMASSTFDHKCTCCTELQYTQRTVELLCPGGKRQMYSYTDVLECGCAGAVCTPDSQVKN